MFASILAKIAGTAAGGFLKSYGVMIIGGIAAAFILWYVWSAERAKTARVELKIENKRLVIENRSLLDAIDMNKTALDECITINARNSLQAIREAQRVKTAQAEAAELRRQLTITAGEERAKVEDMRGTDTECRTMDEPLPDWVADRLRD